MSTHNNNQISWLKYLQPLLLICSSAVLFSCATAPVNDAENITPTATVTSDNVSSKSTSKRIIEPSAAEKAASLKKFKAKLSAEKLAREKALIRKRAHDKWLRDQEIAKARNKREREAIRARYHAKFAAEKKKREAEAKREQEERIARYRAEQARKLAESKRKQQMAQSQARAKQARAKTTHRPARRPAAKQYQRPQPARPVHRAAVQRAAVRRAPARNQQAKAYRRPQPVRRAVQRPPARSHYAANVQRGSQRGSQQLSGHFADAPLAHKFIDRMVRVHGFNRNHLNGLFSSVRDTGLRVKPLSANRKRNNKKGAWTRYRSFFLTDRHTNAGVAFWKRNAHHLERASRIYGVPPEYIVGIIGVETIYGGNIGKYQAINALATKAFRQSRRTKFFTKELEQYLLMTRRERLNPLTLKGSTAGALGLCQFMPSNIKPLAVDFDRNGRVDLWTEADAIGSVANYFRKHGWRTGGKVAVPARVTRSAYKKLGHGFRFKHSLSKLKSKGVKPLGKIDNTARLIRLKTNRGEDVWVGGHNFYVITRYNHSTHYAMAVHQLGNRIKNRMFGRSGNIMASSGSYIRASRKAPSTPNILQSDAVKALLRP